MGEIPWLILMAILYWWVQYSGCGEDRPLESRNRPSAIWRQLLGSSAVVWYVMSLDSLNWAIWMRFIGWYWYQSFIDGSNVWGVNRTDAWGPEMDQPPLGGSYFGRRVIQNNSVYIIVLRATAYIDCDGAPHVNPLSVGLIFVVCIGLKLEVRKFIIGNLNPAIWTR